MEKELRPNAKRSFEAHSPTFVDESEILPFYLQEWDGPNQKRLTNRTPLQRERDRILYSNLMRKLTEKYHILYSGQQRIVRNYATHTMRMAQVTRAICDGLRLNSAFGEAIALGAKLGAIPFVHAGKAAISKKVKTTLLELDKKAASTSGNLSIKQLGLKLNPETDPVPSWIKDLQTPQILQDALKFIPWAKGQNVDSIYGSGQEGYWLLSTNPFTRKALPGSFYPETMYGIWRHSRGLPTGPGSFEHEMEFKKAQTDRNTRHVITQNHVTYEAIVVQYADDITWAIENLNDANIASLMNSSNSIYDDISTYLRPDSDVPSDIIRSLSGHDAGGLYTYFITEFIGHSAAILDRSDGIDTRREGLKAGEKVAVIGLSPAAENVLDKIIEYLNGYVFSEPRVANRKTMLETVSRACIEFLFDSRSEFLERRIRQKSDIERWNRDEKAFATSLLSNEVHRLQLAVDTFADMSDQEIFDFVGVESL